MPPPLLTLLAVYGASTPIYCGKCVSMGSARWGPATVQTCHIWTVWGRVGSLTPGSQLCHAHGGTKSKPGGWYSLSPPTDTPLPGDGFMTALLGRINNSSGPPWGWGVGGGTPPPVPLSHAVLTLVVCRQQPRRNLHSALQALDPHTHSLPIDLTHPCFYATTYMLHGVCHVWYAILTIFRSFFQRLTRSKSSVRISNALFSLSGWVDAMSPSSA